LRHSLQKKFSALHYGNDAYVTQSDRTFPPMFRSRIRRFGFLTILVVWVSQLAIQATPLKATGWMSHQLIVLHLIPVALAAWSLWVIVSSGQELIADSTASLDNLDIECIVYLDHLEEHRNYEFCR
jgi:hypothetical protein